MAAKFKISKDKAGRYRFHLKAANGESIAGGQGCKTKVGAEKGIEAVKTTASAAKVVDLTEREPANNSCASSFAHAHQQGVLAAIICCSELSAGDSSRDVKAPKRIVEPRFDSWESSGEYATLHRLDREVRVDVARIFPSKAKRKDELPMWVTHFGRTLSQR